MSACALLRGTAAVAMIVLLAPDARSATEEDCAADLSVITARRPWSLSVGVDGAIGVFFAPFFAQGAVGVGRTLWRRLELEAAFRFGGGPGLVDLEGTFGAGVLIHVERRVDVMLGTRVGYAAFHLVSLGQAFWVQAVSASPVTEVRIALGPRWELRAAPIVGTGYWNGIWGFVVQPGIAVAWRL
jgi:hypothetical protein